MLFSLWWQFYRSTLYIYLYIFFGSETKVYPEAPLSYTQGREAYGTGRLSVLKEKNYLTPLYEFLRKSKIFIDMLINFFFKKTLEFGSSHFFIFQTGSLVMGRVFTNGPGDLGSIPGRVLPKTLKMVLDTSLLNTQQYKVRIKGK